MIVMMSVNPDDAPHATHFFDKQTESTPVGWVFH